MRIDARPVFRLRPHIFQIVTERIAGIDIDELQVRLGFTRIRDRQLTAAHILARADAALYASKRSGRNRVTSAEAVEIGAAA